MVVATTVTNYVIAIMSHIHTVTKSKLEKFYKLPAAGLVVGVSFGVSSHPNICSWDLPLLPGLPCFIKLHYVAGSVI